MRQETPMKNFKDDYTLLELEEVCDWKFSTAVLEIASDEECLERLRELEFLHALTADEREKSSLLAEAAAPRGDAGTNEGSALPELLAAREAVVTPVKLVTPFKGMVIDGLLGSAVTFVFLLSVESLGASNPFAMGVVSVAIGGGLSWVAARSFAWA